MKVLGHFKTITKHKLLVMKYCFSIGLYRQGLLHDLSKYSPSEFSIGCRYYQGTRSPNNAERESKGYSAAWLHHKGRNKHHFEYWTDYSMKKKGSCMEGVLMPRNYVAEMLMDRIAASKVYNKDAYTAHDPLAYYIQGKTHYLLHPATAAQLEQLLHILDEQGEMALFDYVRKHFLKKRIRRFFNPGK